MSCARASRRCAATESKICRWIISPGSSTMTMPDPATNRSATTHENIILCGFMGTGKTTRSEEHTSELQSHLNLVCRLLLEKKKKTNKVANMKTADRYF